MKSYSLDLRQKVVDAYQMKEGSIRGLAKRFAVGKSFVQELLKRHKKTGTIEPKPHAGGTNPILDSAGLEKVEQLVREQNDLVQEEYCKKLEEKHQIKISRQTLGRALKKLNLTRKKKLYVPQNETQKELSRSVKSL